jgi:hypothetical protein
MNLESKSEIVNPDLLSLEAGTETVQANDETDKDGFLRRFSLPFNWVSSRIYPSADGKIWQSFVATSTTNLHHRPKVQMVRISVKDYGAGISVVRVVI